MEAAREKDGDAEYLSGYLYMTLPFRAKPLKDYTIQELGSYVHEYVHFLQNISTPWGLYESMRLYEQIACYFEQLKEYDLKAPLYVPDDELYRKSHQDVKRVLDLGRGADFDYHGLGVHNLKFAEQTDFKIHRVLETVGKRKVPKIELEFSTQSHGRRQILFGAWSIKESMAAMIQELVDPKSQDRHADLPYKLIERFSKDLFPNIATDKRKLSAICYASLFSLSPAQEFINLASHAEEYPDISSDQLLTEFFGNSITCAGEQFSFEEFHRHISAKFLTIVSKLCDFEIKYIPEIIHTTQFKQGNYPLLWFLDDKLDRQMIEEFIPFAGYPLIWGTEDTSIVPSLDGIEDTQKEIIWLMGLETLYKFMTKGICPREKQCQEAGRNTDTCRNTPWRREDPCPMTEIAAIFGLSDANVIRK